MITRTKLSEKKYKALVTLIGPDVAAKIAEPGTEPKPEALGGNEGIDSYFRPDARHKAAAAQHATQRRQLEEAEAAKRLRLARAMGDMFS